MMKKFTLILLSLFLFAGCSKSENKDPESVKSISLEVMSTELYKGKPIELLMTVDSDYQLTEDDFNVFGGSIEIKNKHTAYVTYNSAGTFHLSAKVGDVTSNELTLQVRTNTSSVGQGTKQTQNKMQYDNQEQEIVKKDPNDFTDWENIRDASNDKVTSADEFQANTDSFVNQSILLEGNIPQGSDGTYIETSDGQKINLSGLEMAYSGPVRMYGNYDGNTFHVIGYCSFGGTPLESEKNE